MRRLFSFLCVLSALFFSLPALADEAAARAHFKKAIDLYDKKQYQDALTEFEAAYKEKPSGGIKQNIALCLKGLQRPAEAATAFDEALDEGKDTLKPDTKAAIERELADLTKIVATLQITIGGADEKKQAETVVTIQPMGQQAKAYPPGAQRRPIRLMPGMYVLSAKVPGQAAFEPKKLALISGPPTEINFGDQPATGPTSTLDIHTNVTEAKIKIDGVEVGTGKWTGPVAANKKLRIEVTAPGWRPLAFDMTVPANSQVDSPVTLQPGTSAPGEYRAPEIPQEKPRGRVYLALSGSAEGVSYRLSDAVGAPTAAGLRQGYAGVSAAGRIGFLLSKYVALEAYLEAGVAGSTIKATTTGTSDVKSTMTHWMLMPALRFQTPGHVRFTTGTGIGVHSLTLKNEPMATTGANAVQASGIAAAWLLDAGTQFDLGPLFMEAVLYMNLHGVGTVEDDSNRRALLASPAARIGVRLAIGIPF